MKKNAMQKLIQTIDKEGIETLLPQNLSNEILERMLHEAETMEEHSTEKMSAPMIMIAILHLVGGFPTEENREVHIKPDDLESYFTTYMTVLRLEVMKRDGVISIEEQSLPTIDNIFDLNRNIKFKELGEEL